MFKRGGLRIVGMSFDPETSTEYPWSSGAYLVGYMLRLFEICDRSLTVFRLPDIADEYGGGVRI